jgi:hypothetical protein
VPEVEAVHSSKQEGKDRGMSEQANTKKARRRPLWLKVVLGILKIGWFPAACVAALIGGLTIGYVVVGGQPAAEVFQVQTWKHLVDLVFAAG